MNDRIGGEVPHMMRRSPSSMPQSPAAEYADLKYDAIFHGPELDTVSPACNVPLSCCPAFPLIKKRMRTPK